jgi:hypothetical protein
MSLFDQMGELTEDRPCNDIVFDAEFNGTVDDNICGSIQITDYSEKPAHPLKDNIGLNTSKNKIPVANPPRHSNQVGVHSSIVSDPDVNSDYENWKRSKSNKEDLNKGVNSSISKEKDGIMNYVLLGTNLVEGMCDMFRVDTFASSNLTEKIRSEFERGTFDACVTDYVSSKVSNNLSNVLPTNPVMSFATILLSLVYQNHTNEKKKHIGRGRRNGKRETKDESSDSSTDSDSTSVERRYDLRSERKCKKRKKGSRSAYKRKSDVPIHESGMMTRMMAMLTTIQENQVKLDTRQVRLEQMAFPANMSSTNIGSSKSIAAKSPCDVPLPSSPIQTNYSLDAIPITADDIQYMSLNIH